MSSPARIRRSMSLEEFLQLPERKPPLEYFDGRIERKMSPQKKHNEIEAQLRNAFNEFAKPLRLGRAYVELRCTFAGVSIVADVAFLLKSHIEVDEAGEPVDETPWPPDVHVEIISPKQSSRSAERKLIHSTANGCALGWQINPYQKTVHVYRPGHPVQCLGLDGMLEGDPVLPGFRLAVAELFGWLQLDL